MPIWPQPSRFTPTLAAGRLRHLIDIVKVNPVQDSTGGTDLSNDIIYAKVWASVEAITGMEQQAGQSESSFVTHQVTMRYIGAAPSWQSARVYKAKELVKDRNGYLQQAQGNGTSNAAEPTIWNQTFGGSTADGTGGTAFSWKNIGPAPTSTGVNAAMQVWFQTRQFQIMYVLNPDERNKMLMLMCAEINDSLQQSPTVPVGLG